MELIIQKEHVRCPGGGFGVRTNVCSKPKCYMYLVFLLSGITQVIIEMFQSFLHLLFVFHCHESEIMQAARSGTQIG